MISVIKEQLDIGVVSKLKQRVNGIQKEDLKKVEKQMKADKIQRKAGIK